MQPKMTAAVTLQAAAVDNIFFKTVLCEVNSFAVFVLYFFVYARVKICLLCVL